MNLRNSTMLGLALSGLLYLPSSAEAGQRVDFLGTVTQVRPSQVTVQQDGTGSNWDVQLPTSQQVEVGQQMRVRGLQTGYTSVRVDGPALQKWTAPQKDGVAFEERVYTAPPEPRADDDISVTMPMDAGSQSCHFNIEGTALPDSRIHVSIRAEETSGDAPAWTILSQADASGAFTVPVDTGRYTGSAPLQVHVTTIHSDGSQTPPTSLHLVQP